MVNQDFIEDDNGDIACVNGDFVMDVADDQHVMDLFKASVGHYKQNPLTGIGIINALNGVVDGQLKRIARLNLQADGYKLNSLSAEKGTDNLFIDYTK
jgi:hypothetical protein